jgi:hypothetical protein
MIICYNDLRVTRLMILVAVIVALHQTAFSQIGIQSLLGHRGYEFNAIYQRNFSASRDFSYYGLLDVNAAYDSIGQNQFDFYQSFNLEIVKNTGLALGSTFTNDDILPHLGIYWGIENSSTDISVIPSMAYSINKGTLGFDLDLYFERYWGRTGKWRPYSWLLVNGSSFSDGNREMSLLGFLGLSYRKKVQCGFGAGISAASDDDKVFSNFGFVVSYKFDSSSFHELKDGF